MRVRNFSFFDYYKVKLTFIRSVLATNPSDPNILDTHIIQRQRKLILEHGTLKKEINKYLDQIQISVERGDEEIDNLISRLEDITGYVLSDDERKLAIAGKLESLKETFKELDIKGTTVFFWDKEKNLPAIGDHMILGFLKAAAEAIGRAVKQKNGVMIASKVFTQSCINQYVRCEERFLAFDKDIKREEDNTSHFFTRSLRVMTPKGPRVSLAKSEMVEEGASIDFVLKVMNGSPVLQEHLETLFAYGELSGIGQWRNSGWGQFSYQLSKISE